MARNNFSDKRMADAVNHVIDNNTFTPKISDIIKFDKKYELFTYSQVSQKVFEGRIFEDFAAVDTGKKKPEWIERINLEISGLKEWTNQKQGQ